MRACRASSAAAQALTFSMSAASSASSTAPPALHGAATAGPSPAGGREPYRIEASAAGVLVLRSLSAVQFVCPPCVVVPPADKGAPWPGRRCPPDHPPTPPKNAPCAGWPTLGMRPPA